MTKLAFLIQGIGLVSVLVTYCFLHVSAQGSETELETVMKKVEQDALDFAKEMERVYAQGIRCSSKTLSECPNAHFHECESLLPSTECVGVQELAREECLVSSEGLQCGARYDFFASTVRLGPQVALSSDGNPTDTQVKEALCYSKQAEEYMVNKYEEEKQYWSKYELTPPVRYFGANNGVFRIHPAKMTSECSSSDGIYDATRRPWYVAATTGPKDVLLILDVSGSMDQRGRLDILKKAANRVIDTLAIGDHLGVVLFSDEAQALQEFMVQASEDNRKSMKEAIASIEADGGTNYLAGFNMAFDLLDKSKKNEASSGCTTAFLVLTDGEMTAPTGVNATQVINSINQRREELGVTPLIFMYGLGASAAVGLAAEDPQAIACATGGMWSHVEDGGDLASSMGNYYERFALGLADGANENFVAWVDPYIYSDGYTLGTTVSAPVFDRSVSPAVLIGAVGLSIPLSVMDKALGVPDASPKTLEKLVVRSTAQCPALNITNCVLQSLRLQGGTEEALCPDECVSFVGVRPGTCPNQPDLPSDFWDNTDNKGKSFEERTCCAIGEIRDNGFAQDLSKGEQSLTCLALAQDPTKQLNKGGSSAQNKAGQAGKIVGIVVGVLVGVLLISAGLIHHFKKNRKYCWDDKLPSHPEVLPPPLPTAPGFEAR